MDTMRFATSIYVDLRGLRLGQPNESRLRLKPRNNEAVEAWGNDPWSPVFVEMHILSGP